MAPLHVLDDRMDLHYYGTKLASSLKRLDQAPWPESDKALIRSYIEHSRAQGLSIGRCYKILWTLCDIRKRLTCTFRAAKRGETEALAASINSSPYTTNTRSDHKKVLKKFNKFVRYGDADKTTPYPVEVAWVTTAIKKNELREPDVISEEARARPNQP